jgi:hypothetical protein
VHLQHHPGGQPGHPQRIGDSDHRDLDDIGGAALDGAFSAARSAAPRS